MTVFPALGLLYSKKQLGDICIGSVPLYVKAVLEEFEAQDFLSVSDLVRLTGASYNTLKKIVDKLEDAEIIKIQMHRRTRGNAIFYTLAQPRIRNRGEK